MIEVLIIVASSWPIAVMVLGLTIGIATYRLLNRSMKASEDRAAEYRAQNAVVVHRRDE